MNDVSHTDKPDVPEHAAEVGPRPATADPSPPSGSKLRDALTGLAYAGAGIVAFLLSYTVLSQAFPFPTWEVLIASAALVVLLLTVQALAGLAWVLRAGMHLAIYAAGGIAVAAIAAAVGPAGDEWPGWEIWLVYTGLYALLFIVLPYLAARFLRPPPDRSRFRAIADEAAEAHMRREAALTLLPSHSWYLLASSVTGLAMFGSFATTAIGFYEEIVDPYAHWLIRYGIPIGLSGLAAFIIWSGWNFVFLRMRVARQVLTRLVAYAIGLVILVPLTLAIHTVFGIIGVGGTEGLRAHYMWYADVLNGYYGRAERLRQLEVSFKLPLGLMQKSFQDSADQEKRGGSRCGAGEGDLYRYYSARAVDVSNILAQISEREGSRSTLAKSVEDLRKQIRDPGKDFRSAQQDLGERFNGLRAEILALESQSVMTSLRLFMDALAIVVEQETFFKDWATCQQRSKDLIKDQIKRFLDTVKGMYDDAEVKIARIKADAARTIPRERRIESFPFLDRFVSPAAAQPVVPATRGPGAVGTGDDDIPIFVPMRPFWAVVSYAGQLPGYIALQIALDFSPAILGLLFALLAPLPTGSTRLGRVANAIGDEIEGWWHRHLGPGPAAAKEGPAVAPPAESRPREA